MTDAVLVALLDTLLPGADGMPAAARSGLDLAALRPHAGPLLDDLGKMDFAAADSGARAALLQSLERSRPEEFRRFLEAALGAYYQAPAVLAAFGWRSEPPMPRGHLPAGDDQPVLGLLDAVRARGPIWRR